jgi:selenocysteine-specific elongation factor
MPLTVGTAGHIDHGKTWLVRALTGKDTDRLPEERRRGISIDLGYAPLDLPDGRRLSLVDVPGHERFVRNMVAGATGIDLFLLVIDAAEGARPQTHEHLAILRLLSIDRGVVAVTKADAVDEETVELALEEARELVPEARVVAVSAKTGAGLDELRAALADAADGTTRADPDGPVRMYLDRVFSLRGIGTVVTGTLWSGTIGEGNELRVEPAGIDVRVRSVQVHDETVERAAAGQRVAVNLPGVERERLERGDALVAPGAYPVTYRLDVALEELDEVPAAVTVHLGTADVAARVAHRGRFAQLRLEQPVVAGRGDRVVLRTTTTVGGGVVVDPLPPRRVDVERLELLERGDVAATVHQPVRASSIRHLVQGELAGVEHVGDWIFSLAWLDELRAELQSRLARADPRDPGIDAPVAPWASAIVPLLGLDRRGSRLFVPGTQAVGAGGEELLAELEAAGPNPVKLADPKLGRLLEQEGKLVRVGDGLAVSREAYERAREALLAECSTAGTITIARFRDLLGAGRRSAQLLLERFDADGLTRRVGDERVLRRSAVREQ